MFSFKISIVSGKQDQWDVRPMGQDQQDQWDVAPMGHRTNEIESSVVQANVGSCVCSRANVFTLKITCECLQHSTLGQPLLVVPASHQRHAKLSDCLKAVYMNKTLFDPTQPNPTQLSMSIVHTFSSNSHKVCTGFPVVDFGKSWTLLSSIVKGPQFEYVQKLN